MNKDLRKAVESELATSVREILEKHHPAVAAEISRQIKEGVKYIAKKFIKHLPAAGHIKADETKKKSAGTKKQAAVGAEQQGDSQPVKKQVKPALKKVKVKTKSKAK